MLLCEIFLAWKKKQYSTQLCVVFLSLTNLLFALPAKLSDTGLYQNILTKQVKSENRYYAPQYPLWSDGAEKERWIYLPAGVQIDTSDVDQWAYPVGTKFWKEFSFLVGGKLKRIETRLMEKSSEEEWSFASYLWNADESEALIAPEDGVLNYMPTSPTTTHNIPSVTDCLRCHRRMGDAVLGFSALALSNDVDPLAPHLPKKFGTTLKTLIDAKLLTHNAPEFKNGFVKIPASTPEGRAAMGYLHTNCASCHHAQGSALQTDMKLNFSLFAQTEADLNLFQTALEKKCQNFSLPNEPRPIRIKKGQPDKSALLMLMQAQGSLHMPPIGTQILDQSAVDLIKKWIQSL